MKISTKGRYALRVMTELAMQDEQAFIPLKTIAANQGISVKYLEMIVSMLSAGGFVESFRGKKGGYRLAVHPHTCTVGAVLKMTEGQLAPVACLCVQPNTCDRANDCLTLPMWKQLGQVMDEYLESVTIQDLITGNIGVRNKGKEKN